MKKIILRAILFGMFVVSGCGNQNKEDYDNGTGMESMTETETGDEISERESEPKDGTLDVCHGQTVLEDAEYVYVCGKSHILKVDKESGMTEYLFYKERNDTKFGNVYEYARGQGILAGDYIYFIEEWEDENVSSMWSFSSVKTDGSDYKRVKTFSSSFDKEYDRLVLMDGILYFAAATDEDRLTGYHLKKDGSIGTEELVETVMPDKTQGYGEIFFAQNGNKVLSAVESRKRFGYYLLRDEEFDLCVIEPRTGVKKKLFKRVAERSETERETNENLLEEEVMDNLSLAALNNEQLLFVNYIENDLYLVDTDTFSCRFLTNAEGTCNVIKMDEEYAYYQKDNVGENFRQYQYYKVNLETGEKEELFTLDSFEGTEDAAPWYTMDISIVDNAIYYVGEQDYKLFLMRRELDMPNAEQVLGEAVFDSKISEIGRVETFQETIRSENNPDIVSGELDLEWLVLDDKYAGAAIINQRLREDQQAYIDYLHENAEMYDEWAEYSIPGYSFSSRLSPVYYMDGRYLSFLQRNYDYTGGAHGMPYWVPYTFDLETGEELMLWDIVADDDMVVKERVTRYFTELYEKSPEEYWDNAVEVVNETASLQSLFYLTDEGIVFYYGAYELAPYVGGMKTVTVPYTEFTMKLATDNKE